MSDKSVYEIIKRQNGEAFARAIRDFDNGIFEIENLPRIVRYAGRDAEPLLNYLEALKLSKCNNLFARLLPCMKLDKSSAHSIKRNDSQCKQNNRS